jgi:hypothetical protein
MDGHGTYRLVLKLLTICQKVMTMRSGSAIRSRKTISRLGRCTRMCGSGDEAPTSSLAGPGAGAVVKEERRMGCECEERRALRRMLATLCSLSSSGPDGGGRSSDLRPGTGSTRFIGADCGRCAADCGRLAIGPADLRATAAMELSMFSRCSTAGAVMLCIIASTRGQRGIAKIKKTNENMRKRPMNQMPPRRAGPHSS